MTAHRLAALGALAASLPVVVWVAGVLAAGGPLGAPAPGLFTDALRALFTVLGVAAALFAAWGAARPGWRASAAAQAVLLATPMPLLCLAWLSGAAPVPALGRGILLLAAVSFLILGLGKVVVRTAPRRVAGHGLSGAAGLVLGACVFATRDLWLGWIGL